jgi:N-acetylneuraminic acid mutarotase
MIPFDAEPLPAAVTNNAVAGLGAQGTTHMFSLLGIGPEKTWDAITTAAYSLDLSTGAWSKINPVPGQVGRLAATAVGRLDQVFLFGGYAVDAQGNEVTVPNVDIYQSVSCRWYRGADIPVPVDDSVSGIYLDRYVYLISGWSKTDTVRHVQVYDAQENNWLQATAIPGTPVFGHAGALVSDTIIYTGGAYINRSGNKPKYVPSDEGWMGKIDHGDPAKIQWTRLANHPGAARYRMAAGGCVQDRKVYFAGGTNNPYNYDGIGYDGKPSEPSAVTFAFNLRSGKWELNGITTNPTMDHRGLLVTSNGLIIAGGMEKGQQVTPKVVVLPKLPESK